MWPTAGPPYCRPGLDAGEDRAAAAAAPCQRLTELGPLGEHTGVGQRLVTAGGAVQADVQQRGRGQARGVALRAQDHPFDVVADGLRQPGVAGRVAPPFQDVAFDDQGTRHLALTGALRLRADVDEHRAAACRGPRPPAIDTTDARRTSTPRRYGSSRPLRLAGQFGAPATQPVAVGDLGPTTLPNSEELDHGSQCCIKSRAVVRCSPPAVGLIGGGGGRFCGHPRSRGYSDGEAPGGKTTSSPTRTSAGDRFGSGAARGDRSVPRRRHHPGQHPRRIDRRGVLPGLSRREGADRGPSQTRRIPVRALSGDAADHAHTSTTGTWNTPWAELTLARQAAVITAVHAAANNECDLAFRTVAALPGKNCDHE